MMDIFNQLGGMGQAQQTIGQQLGTPPQQTEAAMQAALPLLLGALTRNATQPGGLDALAGALDRHDGRALDSFGAGQVPDSAEGQKILGHVFGGQQMQAAQAVSRRAGIDPQLALQVLSMLAPLVLAYLGRQRQQGETGGPARGGDLGSILGGLIGGGGLGGLLGGLLGGRQEHTPQTQRGAGFDGGPGGTSSGGSVLGGGSVLPGYPAGGAPSPTQGGGDLFGTLNRALDRDGDGNALDELIGMFGGQRR